MPASIPIRHGGTFTSRAAIRLRETFSRRMIAPVSRVLAFAQALAQSGWTEGRNVRIDIRWGATDPERIRRYAAELVALAPDVILAVSSAATGGLLQATRAVPIVFTTVADPVGAGFVETLARPGGNA